MATIHSLQNYAVDFNLVSNPNVTDRTLVDKGYVDAIADDLAALGRFRGEHDATTGVPVAADIKAGDFWRVSVAGTIVGLTPNEVVEVGDVIYARIDNAVAGADFFSLQANFSSSEDILVGGTFIPAAGTVTGADSVKVALEKLQGNITASIFTLTDGNGTTANGTAVDLGGTVTSSIDLDGNDADFILTLNNTTFSRGARLVVGGLSDIIELVTVSSGVDYGVKNLAGQDIFIGRDDSGTLLGLDVNDTRILLRGTANQSVLQTAPDGTVPLAIATTGYVDSQLGASKFASTVIGDNTNTDYTVNHNLDDTDVIVQVRNVADNKVILVEHTVVDNNNIQLNFGYVVPAASSFRVVVMK